MCPDKELFSAYVDGEIPEPWCSKLKSHISNCEKCRNIVDTYNSIKKTVKSGIIEPSPELFDSTYNRITNSLTAFQPKITVPRHVRRGVSLRTLAAVLAVAFIIPASFFAGRQSVSTDPGKTGTALSTRASVSPIKVNFPGFSSTGNTGNFRLINSMEKNVSPGNDMFFSGYDGNLFPVSNSNGFGKGQIVISFPGLSVYTSNPEGLMPYGTIDIMFYQDPVE